MYLFTMKNPNKAELLHRCGGKLPKNSHFDPKIETVVIVHGWLDGVCRTAWMREIKAQLFKRANYNIILTDWTWGNTIDYAGSGMNSLTVGQQMGFVIKNIMIQKKISGNKFHLIGHSFGAFATGQAARFIKKWKKNKILRRITALDPAFAPVPNGESQRRLFRTDAKFVDVIHSNAGHCFPFFIGTDALLGHVDFFPNGGIIQPSCFPYIFTSLLKKDYFYALLPLLYPSLCPHLQSIQFFKVSINPPNGIFIGARCDSYEDFQSGACKRCCNEIGNDCAVAGMDAEEYFPHKNEPVKPRKYFFNTEISCPYDEDYDFSIYKDC